MSSARMKFLDIGGLVKDLGDERVTPGLAMRYLVGFLIIGPAPYWALSMEAGSVWEWALHLAAVLGAVIVGCRYCARRNPDPEQFCGNFIAVGFVVAMRFLILGTLVGDILGGVAAMALQGLAPGVVNFAVSFASPAWREETLGDAGSTLLSIAFVAALHLLYLWRVGVHLGRLPAPLYRKVRVPVPEPTSTWTGPELPDASRWLGPRRGAVSDFPGSRDSAP